MKIRVYRPDEDGADVYRLWVETLQNDYPLGKKVFDNILINTPVYQKGDHLVAERDGHPIGFIATQAQVKKALGEIAVVLVARRYQRRGIGGLLVKKAVEHLQKRKIDKIQLGGGGYSYFWPGVPSDLLPAIKFFTSLGWHFTETCVDMVLSLDRYKTPNYIYKRIKDKKVSFQIADHKAVKSVLAFEENYFPDFATWYRLAFKNPASHHIMYASSKEEILGTVHISSVDKWEKLLGRKVGSIGAVGVKEEARGKGIGSALVAKATELLVKQGYQKSWIGWTSLVAWYKKLGYEVWREYKMSWKEAGFSLS